MPKRNGYPTRRQDVSTQERHKPDQAGEFEEPSHTGVDRGEEGWGDRASQAYHGGREMVDGVVSRYPYASVLTSFGFGFGFGLGVALLLTQPRAELVRTLCPRFAPASARSISTYRGSAEAYPGIHRRVRAALLEALVNDKGLTMLPVGRDRREGGASLIP